jgi:hypothetical protein
MKYPKKSFKRNLSGYMPYEFREGEVIEEKVARQGKITSVRTR